MAWPMESCRRLAPTTAMLRALKMRSMDAASARCSRARMTPMAVSVDWMRNSRRCTPSSTEPSIR